MTSTQDQIKMNQHTTFDAVVIGAGFSGLYMLHRLREAGLSVRVYEAGDAVGGVWYWNRYPGARCDVESVYYNYTFSDELLQEWTWSSKYAEQPEILSYLNFVADKFDLRRDIQFNTRITSAHFNEENNSWQFQTDDKTFISAKYFISAVGALSSSNIPRIKGLDRFEGQWYHTGNWPHEKVDFKGKKVGVIGTGSSGVQSIPVIAQEAGHLTVFQRTPQFTVPARNKPNDPEYIEEIKAKYSQIKQKMRETWMGLPFDERNRSALEDSPEKRQMVYEKVWEKGGWAVAGTYDDFTINEESNNTISDFLRSKIRETVQNPEVAKKLMPRYFFATKRPMMDTNYFETYNRDNVTLVDVKKAPIEEITSKGLRTTEAEYELDILVFATGYDAITGSLFKIDIRGKNGIPLKEKWANGTQTRTYLGMATNGFPNFFIITGPEGPAVLSNNPVTIEQNVEWIAECIQYLRENNIETIEVKQEAEEGWSMHCKELADKTLYPKTESWYTGANIEGKPSGFLIYVGGVGAYRKKCDEVAMEGYEGFILSSARKTVS